MKNWIVLLSLVISTSVSASTLVKSFDGGVARCKEGADIGFRAYRLKLIGESATNTQKNLDFSVSLFVCASTPEGLRLLPIRLNSIVAKPFLNESNELDNIYTELSNTRLFAFIENAEVLGDVELKENAEGKIQARLSIPHMTNSNQVILNLKAVQTIKGKNGQLLDRSPVIASTFLLNL